VIADGGGSYEGTRHVRGAFYWTLTFGHTLGRPQLSGAPFTRHSAMGPYSKWRVINRVCQWSDNLSPRPDPTKAFPCDINKGVIDDKGILLPMTANIYVDDVLAAAAHHKNMLRLLAAIIEAIFTV